MKTQKPHKWNEERVIKELKKVISDIGHFPTQYELSKINRYDLSHAIRKYGGIIRFRMLFGDKLLHKPNGYWTEKRIINELKNIKNKLGRFPKYPELEMMKKHSLIHAVRKYGGINKFREIFNVVYLRKPKGYWTDETVIEDLVEIKKEIGHFPTLKELYKTKRSDLTNAIIKSGGMNRFKLILNEKIIQASPSYWTDEVISEELKGLINRFGHFPTVREIQTIGRMDLSRAITIRGGFNKFRKILGYPISLYQQYISELMSYTGKRAKGTENIIEVILQGWCMQNNLSEPSYNKKLSKGNVIEFVCNTNKKIGIDVTNTKTKSVIYHKWKTKNYYKYLDELWIVVFSDVFVPYDYQKWNAQSPDNVKVFSIYDFLKELDYSVNESLKNKIDKYCSCTFHTKDELKN